ncbi:MAG: peptidylprolyl isomerase [Cyclobacteriaceae bacterium]|nr:peptidylprolyl isomerase [Cyclobacteriaceae bacterium]
MAKREKRNKNRGSAGNNRKSGDDFLSKNRHKAGVIETDTGLQYLMLEEGSGGYLDEAATVSIHQRCTLANGKVIEDTYKDNVPDQVAMNDLIAGYREGLLLMKKGGRARLFVPPELAWGKKGSGSKIPPNALLIFDVRLVDFW